MEKRHGKDAFIVEMKRLAFSRILTALRLRSPFNDEVRCGLAELKEEFEISEDLYVQELRRVSHDECIRLLAENIKGARLSWLHEGHVMVHRLMKRRRKGRLCSKKTYDAINLRKSKHFSQNDAKNGLTSRISRSDVKAKKRKANLAGLTMELQESLNSIKNKGHQIANHSFSSSALESSEDDLVNSAFLDSKTFDPSFEKMSKDFRLLSARRKTWSVDQIAERLRARTASLFGPHNRGNLPALNECSVMIQANHAKLLENLENVHEDYIDGFDLGTVEETIVDDNLAFDSKSDCDTKVTDPLTAGPFGSFDPSQLALYMQRAAFTAGEHKFDGSACDVSTPITALDLSFGNTGSNLNFGDESALDGTAIVLLSNFVRLSSAGNPELNVNDVSLMPNSPSPSEDPVNVSQSIDDDVAP